MILNPGVLALLAGSSVVFLMSLFTAGLGFNMLRRWDFSSSSAYQLSLERKTYLISTIMNYIMGFALASTFFFIFTVDDIHKLLVGAMCATGSLNANPVGWYALWSKVALFFLAGIWIAINYVDTRVEDYPLFRMKYGLLFLVTPVLGLDLYLQMKYFLGIEPDIITSCCGSLFSDAGGGAESSLSYLPMRPVMLAFYGNGLIFIVLAAICLKLNVAAARYLLSFVSAGFLIVASAAIVSFISIYIYELPTHHCPFDMLQAEYNFIGYPVYAGMLFGVFFGILPGIFQPLKRNPSLKSTLERVERKWLFIAACCVIGFVSISSWPLLFGEVTLKVY